MLKLLNDSFAPNDRMVETKISSPCVSAQAFISKDGTRRVLLVNKRNRPLRIAVPGLQGAEVLYVDQESASKDISHKILLEDAMVLNPYSIAAVTLKNTR